MVGGTVCIPSSEERLNDLSGCINTLKANWAFLTPTVASTIRPSDVPSLRTLLLGGEHATTDNFSTWAGGDVRLINSYGPAECSIWSTRRFNVPVGADPAVMGHRVGCAMWVVAEQNHDLLVPVGCAGELLIEGPIVGRGYLNDKTKTDAAFINDPAWSRPSSATRRFYKTGDIVRYNPDGSVSFVRRKDTQVKIRGQRIELGEVETHMAGCPLVQQSIACAPSSGPYGSRLVAVMTLATATATSSAVDAASMSIIGVEDRPLAARAISDLRHQVSVHLPSYMVPTIWIVVTGLPRLTSGKTNRKAVTSWLQGLLEREREDIARIITSNDTPSEQVPLSPLQLRLQKVWSYVLNVPTHRIGLHQPFLSIGGDSIAAIQVVTRCRSEGISVTVGDVLRQRTVARLSEVAKDTETCTEMATGSYVSEMIDTPLSLSPMQHMFFGLEPDGRDHFNQSFLVDLAETVDEHDVVSSLRAVVSHHSMLRARFAPHDGQWYQTITNDIDGSLSFNSCIVNSMEDVETLAAAIETTLNIRDGPIMAAKLFETSSGQNHLLVTAHHLVVDLVSWRVILADVEHLLSTGERSLNQSPGCSFPAWSVAVSEWGSTQHDTFRPNVGPADFEYWGVDQAHNIWADVVESTAQLDASTSQALLGDLPHASYDTETIDVLLAAIAHAFRLIFTDRLAPAIFNEGHGREQLDRGHIDHSRTVGWFTSIYPVSVETQGIEDVVELVRQTKDVRRQMSTNGLSYMAHRYGTEEGRRVEGSAIEVLFNYTGQYQQLSRSDSMLKYRTGGTKESCSPQAKRFALLEVTASFEDGRFNITVLHNRRMQHAEGLHCFAKACVTSLKEAVVRLSDLAPQYTLADFPSMSLTYEQLDDLVASRLAPLASGNDTLKDVVENVYPCSPMQQGIIMSQRKAPTLYQVHEVWEVGTVDGTAVDNIRIQKAWQDVVNRHAVLRTVFLEGVYNEDAFLQAVLRSVSATITVSYCDTVDDVRKLSSDSSLSYSSDRPAVHLTICPLPDSKVCLALGINHALTDGFSAAILRRDLALAYDGRLSQTARLQFQAYVDLVRKASTKTSLTYWAQHLTGVEVCRFPCLHDDRPLHDQALQTQRVPLSVPSGKIRDFCRAENITIANLCQAAWALLLRTFLASDQICFGIMVSGRDKALDHVEDMAGPMISMFPFFLDVSGSSTSRDLLKQAEDCFLNLMAHQDCSLADIHRLLQLGGEHLFNTAMSFQTTQSFERTDTTLKIKDLGAYDPTEFDIFVNVHDGGEGMDLDVTFNYWLHNTSKEMAESVAGTYDAIITALVESTDKPIAQLDMLSQADRARIEGWNSHSPVLLEETVHRVVGRQATERPDAPAVTGWDGDLTFRELDTISSAFADHLRSLRAVPHGRWLIPFAMSKSIWVPVTMLAILKAGAACVALDPSHPQSRIAKIMEDAQADIVVTTPEHERKISAIPTKMVSVSGTFFRGLGRSCVNNQGPSTPHDPAFVVFTSGQYSHAHTVGVSQAYICHRLDWNTEGYRYHPRVDAYQCFCAWCSDEARPRDSSLELRGLHF